MELNDNFEKVREAVADCLGLEPDEIEPDSRLVDDLGADSLDFVDLIFKLEEEFGVKLRDDELNFLSRIDVSDPDVVDGGHLTAATIEKLPSWLPADAFEDPTKVTPAMIVAAFSVRHLWQVVEKKLAA